MLTVTITRAYIEQVTANRWKQCRTEAGDSTEHCKRGEIYGYVEDTEPVKRDEEVFKIVVEENVCLGEPLARLIQVIAEVATSPKVYYGRGAAEEFRSGTKLVP